MSDNRGFVVPAESTGRETMHRALQSLRLVEAASFVAAPSAALHLAQLGARVIRIDPVGGGMDAARWPRAASGESLYWQGLNKGKESVAIELSQPEGRELAQALITAPGEGAGLFVTNYPQGGFLSHERLAARRPDLITVRVQGWADGGPAVDYTINAATGLPLMTGPVSAAGPVNHVLPAWDLLTGALAAMQLLAAERYRRETGLGQELLLPLSSVAFGALGALGQLAEVGLSGEDRPRSGNHLFGAFGRDYQSADGQRVMLVAITRRQWQGVVRALGIGEAVAALEARLAVSFADDEGARYRHRAALDPIVEAAVAALPLSDLSERLKQNDVLWGPYRSLAEAMAVEPELSEHNPMMARVRHPGGLEYLTPGGAATSSLLARETPQRAPVLGEHTATVLADVLGLNDAQIGQLIERKLIAVNPLAGA
jgi:2-methylfumaryl-CoA isomerase